MLFQSSLRRELALNFGATLVALITIVLTIVLIRTLGQASRGSINPQDVMLFMAYSTLGRLPTILTLSLFVAMVSTLMRLYRDSEMVVWFSSGRSLVSFLAPLFRFSWPVLLIVALTSLFVWPWANQQTRDMQQRYAGRSDIDRIAPGQFQESSGGKRVFFIDREVNADSQSSNNVFIAANEKGKNSVTTAQSGRIEIIGDKKVLVLENGQRLENENGKNSLQISNFEEYGSAVGSASDQTTPADAPRLLSTLDLVMSPTSANRGELAWRLGLALAAVNFVVLAVALANANPRGGRSSNYVFIVLIFLAYNNLLNLGQSWVSVGSVSFSSLLLLLHGGVLSLSLLWLVKRNANWTLRSVFQPRAKPVPTAHENS